MSKELQEQIWELLIRIMSEGGRHQLNSDILTPYHTQILTIFDRYAAEREKQARIEEVTRIRKRVGGSTVATNEYRAWLDERISALKETTK